LISHTRLLTEYRFHTGRFDVTEIHESARFPETLRDGVTDGLEIILGVGNIYRPIAARLGRAISAAGAHCVIDLCSGGGGPWVWLHRFLRRQISTPLGIYLTDKFPNIAAFQRAQAASDGAIRYCEKSIDVTALPGELAGFRTVFTSFHHFAPNDAAAILQNAVDARQGIAIFEAARRRFFGVLLTLLMPVGALVCTPLLRPFRASRLFFTYLVPIIPFVLWFDGVLSCLRAYSVEELTDMVSRLNAEDYKWEIGEEPDWLAPITYVIGYPKNETAL
jgi:hypothetical protein